MMPVSLLNFEKTTDGNLRITLTENGKAELPDLIENLGQASDEILLELMTHQLGNGWETISPDEVGALTDSLIITDSGVRDDDGKFVKCKRLYWHPNYMVENPIELLQTKGQFIMTGAAN